MLQHVQHVSTICFLILLYRFLEHVGLSMHAFTLWWMSARVLLGSHPCSGKHFHSSAWSQNSRRPEGHAGCYFFLEKNVHVCYVPTYSNMCCFLSLFAMYCHEQTKLDQPAPSTMKSVRLGTIKPPPCSRNPQAESVSATSVFLLPSQNGKLCQKSDQITCWSNMFFSPKLQLFFWLKIVISKLHHFFTLVVTTYGFFCVLLFNLCFSESKSRGFAIAGRFTLDLTPPIITVQSIASMSESTCLGTFKTA